MPFITTITRRKEDCGITLRSKIVTPKHKLTRRRDYPIRIKKSTLSDYECCVIDNATIKTRLSNRNDMDSLSYNIDNMDSSGSNDTKISYSIEDTDSTYRLSDYLSPSGEILQRPLYGTPNDISGNLVITVKKNEESVVSKIPVMIRPYTASEIVNDTNMFAAATLWDAIRNGNDPAGRSGYNNIISPLDFTKVPDVSAKSDIPIQVIYEIDDELTRAGAPVSSLAEPRIKADGTVSRMAYLDAAARYAVDKSVAEIRNGRDGISTQNIIDRINAVRENARVCFSVGKIAIKAKISLDGVVSNNTITISAGVLSKCVSKNEIIAMVKRQLKLVITDIDGSGNSATLGTYTFSDSASNNPLTITKVAGHTTKLSVYRYINSDPNVYDQELQIASTNNSTHTDLKGIAAIETTNAAITDYDSSSFDQTKYENKFVQPGVGPIDGSSDNGAYGLGGRINTNSSGQLYELGIWHDGFIENPSGTQNFAISVSVTIPGNIYADDSAINFASDASTSVINLVKGIQMVG